MRFFKIVGLILAAILLINLMKISVEIYLMDGVYACSSLNRYAPSEVKKKCRK